MRAGTHTNKQSKSSVVTLPRHSLAIGDMESAASLPLNVAELSSVLAATHDISLPQRFIVPETERPHSRFPPQHVHYRPNEMLLLDLSKLDTVTLEGRRSMVMAVHEACKKWGFFQVINHGVPSHLMQNVKKLAFDFFQLPTEVKERCTVAAGHGYEGNHAHTLTMAPWLEALNIRPQLGMDVRQLVERVWPNEGNQRFIDTIEECIACVSKLADKIWLLLAESLELEADTFSKHLEGKSSTSIVRFNHYPPCPQPSMAFGAVPHTDPSFFTLLYQDEAGLQMQHRESSSWADVHPNSEAFLINIGDGLEAWTNDIYLSPVHRSLVYPDKPRLSIAFFQFAPKDHVITPPHELIDEEHPQKYRPFRWGEVEDLLRERRLSSGLQRKEIIRKLLKL